MTVAEGGTDAGRDDVVVTLPENERAAFKEPLGPIEPDPDVVLAAVDGPLIAVGDAVTYHLVRAGRRPDVAVVDGRTEREAVDAEVREAVAADAAVEVTNPPATLTDGLLRELCTAIGRGEPATIYVHGEEDLATLPAILVAPAGASVVYGQPGQGMVHVSVDDAVRERVRRLLSTMEGDHDRLWSLCDRE
ncbi:MAG: hypothetical protein ACI91T_002917 [Natronomonas sp.]|jgi:uncharacterized protein (UPF0218 family)